MIHNTITDDDISPYLRRRNSIYRFNIRQIEKNRFPAKCSCIVCGGSFLCRGIEEYIQRQYYLGPDKKGSNISHVCRGCGLKNKLKIAVGTLYQLINAIPHAERDWQEIFPADFRYALIPLPQQTSFGWRTFEQWRSDGVLLCGMSAKSATGQDSLRLRDYSEATRLLTKYSKYEFAYRQKAASPVRDILTITSDLVDLPATESRLSLYLWGRLTPPETQQVLKRIGRLYKNSCWWPKREKRRLFDNTQASSWNAQQWKGRNKTSIEFDPADAVLLEKRERRETFRIARSGGQVIYLGKPAKRHASLAKTRAAYNEQWDSYTNNNRLDRTLREQRSLNISRETIEVRNAMIANLERDFAPRNEREAA
jgi:hypothetical protein